MSPSLRLKVNPAEQQAVRQFVAAREQLAALLNTPNQTGHWRTAGVDNLCQLMDSAAALLRPHLCFEIEPHPRRVTVPLPPGSPLFALTRRLEGGLIYYSTHYVWQVVPENQAHLELGGQWIAPFMMLAEGQRLMPVEHDPFLCVCALRPLDGSGVCLNMTTPMRVTGPWRSGDPRSDPDDQNVAVVDQDLLHWAGEDFLAHRRFSLTQVAALLGGP